jgi:two-component system NtrC family sensor kinase
MSAAPSIDAAAERSSRPSVAPRTGSRFTIVVAMLLAILVVATLAYWDEERESAAAFDDFAHEQATVALSAAGDVATRLDEARRLGGPPPSVTSITHEISRIERPGELMLLVLPPGATAFSTTNGRTVAADTIARALAGNDTSVRLSRPEAAALGLPARTAVAGLARLDAGPLGRWSVVVVASASRERDREMRARSRLLLSVALASGLVFVFGTFALRKQRKELELERELALADLQLQRDERLVRAGRIAMMGTLATGVAHEIGTPLGVIAGRAEQLLARTANDERAEKSARAILEQTERIGQVVRGFLDLARGGQPVLGAVSPSSIVGGAVRLVRHRFEKAAVELTITVADALPAVHCDARLIEHALVNLLLNACEACDRGGTVSIDVRRTEGTPEKVSFVVVDDGPGITPEDAARATEPFFTTKPPGTGTGLGLAITHEIVKSHHGMLEIAPEPTRGTRACMQLPVAPEGSNA